MPKIGKIFWEPQSTGDGVTQTALVIMPTIRTVSVMQRNPQARQWLALRTRLVLEHPIPAHFHKEKLEGFLQSHASMIDDVIAGHVVTDSGGRLTEEASNTWLMLTQDFSMLTRWNTLSVFTAQYYLSMWSDDKISSTIAQHPNVGVWAEKEFGGALARDVYVLGEDNALANEAASRLGDDAIANLSRKSPSQMRKKEPGMDGLIDILVKWSKKQGD